jgi:hypothetical protein
MRRVFGIALGARRRGDIVMLVKGARASFILRRNEVFRYHNIGLGLSPEGGAR